MKNESCKDYFLGLDIGTDSVGYAVSDREYRLRKYKGEPVWGLTTFDAANQSEERRSYRTARRRLDRRQWRLSLLSELFAKEIEKTDPRFFIRLKESSLYREDTTNPIDKYIFFNDTDYGDKQYHTQYPTIHHLICELMNSDKPHDIRLVYLACAWLIAHRGHFLSDISKDNVDVVGSFENIYNELMGHFDANGYDRPWDAEASDILNILRMKRNVSSKEKAFATLLYNGKMPKDKKDGFLEEELEKHPYSRDAMIKLLSGGSVAPKALFLNTEEYDELSSFSLSIDDVAYEELMSYLGDNGEIVSKLKVLSDSAALIDLLGGNERISISKVDIYEQHKKDLKQLKYIVRKYIPQKYSEVFRIAKKGLANYVSYSYNLKSVKTADEVKKATKEDFCKYLRGILKSVKPTEEDAVVFDEMTERLERNTFLPKQVDSDNRIIPYQLYYIELKDILSKASVYLPFLAETDENGLSVSEKILSIFEFRVPYFVGPLHKNENSGNSWIVKKNGRILPWNFDTVVDTDACEQEFIRRLINKCTYLPAEEVLPKDSLLYSRFSVLNEINNLKIDEVPISVELKQKIYTDIFETYAKVTPKRIKDYCIANGYMSKDSSLSGIDITVKSSLKSYIDFKRLLSNGVIGVSDAEEIIKCSSYSENKYRFRKWLSANYPQLSTDDVKYLSSRNYKDFGRLSEKFLVGTYGTSKDGCGEAFNIIEGLWNTNCNIMQLLSDEYTFSETILEEQKKYYSEEKMTLSQRLDSMYVPNAVKRPIIRTMDIISDVTKAMGGAPAKIFIEMARGASEDQKGRTTTRKDRLKELYAKVKNEDISHLKESLEAMGDSIDNKLQSERLYLYYLQLGRCMYSGEPIDIDQLMNDKVYDIDHIWPQSKIKDDSVLKNKVLVLSKLNGEKGDRYPIDPAIRNKMKGFWDKLHSNGLLDDEKYKRLTRNTPFTDDELMGFINRQIVETRQSTKAVATILREKYPKTEIVYVKANHVSEFRHAYNINKSRLVNDLHHAKDAYLNIVVGNVYDTKFTRKWFKLSDGYNMKTEKIFEYPVKTPDGTVVWQGAKNLDEVKKQYRKNHVHITRYAFCRTGGLFDQMPLKAGEGLVPRKKGLPTEKYGGYNKPSASFFVPVSYEVGKKKDVMIMPVELMYSERFKTDETFRIEYSKRIVEGIVNKQVNDIVFPLGERILKINTVFEFDGMRMCLSGKSGGGRQLIMLNIIPFVCDSKYEEYIRCVEKFVERLKKNPELKYDPEHSQLTKEGNLELYDLYAEKLLSYPYSKRPSNPTDAIEKGRLKFEKLEMIEQIKCLSSIHMLFGRLSGGTDLTAIGGVAKAGATVISSNISNWKKSYENVYIIDQSSSGLYEKKSENLLDLL